MSRKLIVKWEWFSSTFFIFIDFPAAAVHFKTCLLKALMYCSYAYIIWNGLKESAPKISCKDSAGTLKILRSHWRSEISEISLTEIHNYCLLILLHFMNICISYIMVSYWLMQDLKHKNNYCLKFYATGIKQDAPNRYYANFRLQIYLFPSQLSTPPSKIWKHDFVFRGF